ncbi:MAG: hypothetical protein JWN64_423 [Parcubacteria group bacterium]|nr:hypothetical protein [Parcubacteria group bacterium]
MPKVTMFIQAGEMTKDFLLKFPIEKASLAIRQMVADAASTEGCIFGVEDVDFLPTFYPAGTKVSELISIEIETIGYPERKAKLTESAVRQLKLAFLQILAEDPAGITLDPDKPLVWLKFQDPDGHHI